MEHEPANEWERRYQESIDAVRGEPLIVPEWMGRPRWLPFPLRSQRVVVRSTVDTAMFGWRCDQEYERWATGNDRSMFDARCGIDTVSVRGTPADRFDWIFPEFVGRLVPEGRTFRIEGVVRCTRPLIVMMNAFIVAAVLWGITVDQPPGRVESALFLAGFFWIEWLLLLFATRRSRLQRVLLVEFLESATSGSVSPAD